ncbi:TetR/AcrR family transcriptional regulator [Maritalea mediterranea]|uniref:TetR/AcrR family transcriptional regulator n=1 Tax=Maritalea mediterranea TaxID=2909667 RepID=A0ABS9E9G3_9HYPH|nr:TetR/AcrR family transcriptional regulator [Maritalea mediterranea]MCF4099514.1 TetR/AcrR family transcriptional regulator [Maritalea mediterranea]
MAKRTITRDQIVKEAHKLVRAKGARALTFEAVARQMGVTKQAIIYWFPKKGALIEAMLLPSLEAEALAGQEAATRVETDRNVRQRFAAAIVDFHLSDLERFRTMYLSPQLTPDAFAMVTKGGHQVSSKVHAVTAQMYRTLAEALIAEGFATSDTARRKAFLLHTNVLGLVLMASLSDALNDPLAHDLADLRVTLLAQLA